MCILHITAEQSNSYSVLVLTPQDGQQNIVTTTKTLCHTVMHGSLKTSDIDTTLVNKKLSGKLTVYLDAQSKGSVSTKGACYNLG